MAQGRYINILTDFGFKRVFGDKEILTAFLTDLLQPQSPITDITFLDKEFDGYSEYDRGVIYDLLCQTEDGGSFIVEMQNKSQPYFSDRILYYLSRYFSRQGEKGEPKWDFELKPVYGIFFLNFHLRGFEKHTVRTVQLKVNETGEIFSDKLKIFTLELPAYRRMKEEDCKTRVDYWLYNITNLETMTTSIPFQQQQPAFGRVANIAELVRMTPEELNKYNISIDSYRTHLAIMKNERAEGIAEGVQIGLAEGMQKGMAEGMQKGMAEGLQKGMAEGIQKGRAEGRAEGLAEGMLKEKIESAKQMMAIGMTDEQICMVTKLSISEVSALRQ